MVSYIVLRWPGKCSQCRKRVTRGSQAILLGPEKKLVCLGCENLVKEYRDRVEARGGGRLLDKGLLKPSLVTYVPVAPKE